MADVSIEAQWDQARKTITLTARVGPDRYTVLRPAATPEEAEVVLAQFGTLYGCTPTIL